MTMKKQYVNPLVEVVEIKTQQILMMSNLGSTDATSGNLSRDFILDTELPIEPFMGE